MPAVPVPDPEELELPELPEPADDSPIEPSGQLDRWRRRTVTGGVLTGFTLGLQEVLYPKQKEDMAVVVEAGEPPGDRPIEVDLDPDDPGASTVTVRR